jgi:hypothetical protein
MGERATHQQLRLERRKEGLRHRVVIRIAHSAHGRQDPRLAAPSAEGQARVLAATVGMVNEPRLGATIPQGYVELDDEGALQGISHGPAHHTPAERLQHHRQVQPAAPGPDVGDVRDPQAIGAVGGKRARHQVGRRCRIQVADRGPQSSTPMRALQAGLGPRRRWPGVPRIVAAGGDA